VCPTEEESGMSMSSYVNKYNVGRKRAMGRGGQQGTGDVSNGAVGFEQGTSKDGDSQP
jgi:hypothetical protein